MACADRYFPRRWPARRTRAEKFDLLVLDAFSPVDLAWHDRLTKLDIAVDEVPKIHAHDPESVTWPPEVIADGPVPLSRLIPAGIDRHGNTTRARIVLFRRPLEQRAKDPEGTHGSGARRVGPSSRHVSGRRPTGHRPHAARRGLILPDED